MPMKPPLKFYFGFTISLIFKIIFSRFPVVFDVISVKYLYLTLLQNAKGHFIILKITLLIPGFSTENQNYSILTDRIPSNFSVLLCTKNLNLAFFPLE